MSRFERDRGLFTNYIDKFLAFFGFFWPHTSVRWILQATFYFFFNNQMMVNKFLNYLIVEQIWEINTVWVWTENLSTSFHHSSFGKAAKRTFEKRIIKNSTQNQERKPLGDFPLDVWFFLAVLHHALWYAPEM